MPLPPIPRPWPFSPESAWRVFSDALTQTTDPESGFWRIECRRELERIARCRRSSPVEPLRGLVPALTIS